MLHVLMGKWWLEHSISPHVGYLSNHRKRCIGTGNCTAWFEVDEWNENEKERGKAHLHMPSLVPTCSSFIFHYYLHLIRHTPTSLPMTRSCPKRNPNRMSKTDRLLRARNQCHIAHVEINLYLLVAMRGLLQTNRTSHSHPERRNSFIWRS